MAPLPSPVRKRLVRELIAIAAGALLLAAGSWYVLNLKCDSEAFLCENSGVEVHPSPSGKWQFAVFVRGCGATVADLIYGSVLPAGHPLPDSPGNAFEAQWLPGHAIDGGATPAGITLHWVDDAHVRVVANRAVRIRDSHNQVGAIHIAYEQSP
jgi:hypothetical protein